MQAERSGFSARRALLHDDDEASARPPSASVTSEAEVLCAASGGADIIDCKDPAMGALGALPHVVVARIREAVPAHIPVSATIGDPPPEPEARRRRGIARWQPPAATS